MSSCQSLRASSAFGSYCEHTSPVPNAVRELSSSGPTEITEITQLRLRRVEPTLLTSLPNFLTTKKANQGRSLGPAFTKHMYRSGVRAVLLEGTDATDRATVQLRSASYRPMACN